MKKKSIAIVIKCLLGNGAEKVVQNQSALFLKYGHDVHIFCFTDTQEIPINEKIPIHIFPVNGLKWLPRTFRKKFLTTKLDHFIEKKMGTPDLVLSHLNVADRVLSQSRHNVAMLIHMHVSQFYLLGLSEHEKIAKIAKMRSIYQHRKCIAVSKGVSEDFKELFPSCDVHTIYNPLDSEYVKSQSNAAPSPLDPPAQYLVHVGSLTPVKRHDLLLQAYSLSEQALPLLIIGKGPLEDSIRAQIKELKLEDKVHLVGFTSNPYPYIKKSRGLILSSQSESLSTVILEAISLGTPVISTDCPCGPREMLPELNLVTPNEAIELAKKMNELVDSPENFKTTLPSTFSEKCIINQYLNLF